MPRCVDAIFQTIEAVQAPRFVFVSDKMNMFEVQSDVDAAMQRQQHLHKQMTKSARK